jgi:hypothetical protein
MQYHYRTPNGLLMAILVLHVMKRKWHNQNSGRGGSFKLFNVLTLANNLCGLGGFKLPVEAGLLISAFNGAALLQVVSTE